MLGPTLLEVGREDQKKQWVETTIRGETIWCQGYSEPGSGSDLAAARTRADLDGDHFVVNGQKIWTSSAHYDDMLFLPCRTEQDKPQPDAPSYLLPSTKPPGIAVRPLTTLTGRAEFHETFYTTSSCPAHKHDLD